MRTRVILSWSGGKDSALALQQLRADDDVEVVGLLTSITSEYDRVAIHGLRRSLLEAQVDRVNLPLFEIVLAPHCSNDDYERAFLDAVASVRTKLPGVEAIAFGDLFLADVRAYRERLLAKSGLAPMFPLWMQDTSRLAHRFISDGFVARIICVDTTQLDASFIGREFDDRLLADMPSGVDPCGERGEFHTFVSNGPDFSSAVCYRLGESVLRDDRFMYCDMIPC